MNKPKNQTKKEPYNSGAKGSPQFKKCVPCVVLGFWVRDLGMCEGGIDQLSRKTGAPDRQRIARNAKKVCKRSPSGGRGGRKNRFGGAAHIGIVIYNPPDIYYSILFLTVIEGNSWR